MFCHSELGQGGYRVGVEGKGAGTHGGMEVHSRALRGMGAYMAGI